MVKRRLPGPSFRPNPKLSHLVYKGGESQHYEDMARVSREATGGQEVGVIQTSSAPPTPRRDDGQRD